MRPLLKGPPPSGMEKQRRRYQDLRSRIVDGRLGEILDQLWKSLCRPPNERQAEPRAAVAEKVTYLLERGMHGVSEVLFMVNVGAFHGVAASEVLNSLPSPESLKRWLTSAGVDQQELAKRLLETPAETYSQPALEWLFETEDPSRLGPFIILLVRGERRPEHLNPPQNLLADLLGSDNRGKLLNEILALVPETLQTDQVFRSIKGSPRALDQVLRSLPIRLSDPKLAEAALGLAQAVFAELPRYSGAERRTGCAQLARLIADILLLPSSGPNSEDVLRQLGQLSRALHATAPTEELRSSTWVLENLAEGEILHGQGVGVNLYGARHLIQTLRQVARGVPTATALEALAQNVGLKPIGEAEGAALYDPILHEDQVGGLLPGAPVVYTQRGWRFEGEVLLRAPVRPRP